MKIVIYIMLSIFCVSCRGQNIRYNGNQNSRVGITSIDTLSMLTLQNKQYGSFKYTILLLEFSDVDKLGYRIKKIVVNQNNKTLTSILLPNTEDVKNFSITKITKTKNGFKITVNWGGGNYFYSREFNFKFKDKQFYLDSLEMNSSTQEPVKETRRTKKVSPAIPINKFDIISYLDND